MASKRPPEAQELMPHAAPSRPPRKRSSGDAAAPAGARRPLQELTGNEVDEAVKHRQALEALGDDANDWAATQALIYVQRGDRIYQHACLWLFPDESRRFLDDRPNEGPYVVVRLQGQARLRELSLGVLRVGGTYVDNDDNDDADKDDDGGGVVVRIVSVEKDGDLLLRPHEVLAVPSLACHIGEVIRKHGLKCNGIAESESLHGPFFVLRTEAYLDARDKVLADDCPADEWHDALETMHACDSASWDLVNRCASLHALDRIAACERLDRDRVHVVEDIFLVKETLPLESQEFVVAAQWAVRKSIKGTGSIPKCKLWDPVVVKDPEGHGETFRLMRFA